MNRHVLHSVCADSGQKWCMIVCRFSVSFVHNSRCWLQNCLLVTYTHDDHIDQYFVVQTLFLYWKNVESSIPHTCIWKAKNVFSLSDHFEFVSNAHVHSHIKLSQNFCCRGHGLTMRSVLYRLVSMVMTTLTSWTGTLCTVCVPTLGKNDVYFKWWKVQVHE